MLTWPYQALAVIFAGGATVMISSLLITLAPRTTEAASPLRINVIIRSSTTRHAVGVTSHHQLIEVLASASSLLHAPMSYHFVGSSMMPLTMFGAKDDAQAHWVVRLNGAIITDLQNVLVQRGDLVTVDRQGTP